jgi:hypothetical protein
MMQQHCIGAVVCSPAAKQTYAVYRKQCCALLVQ